LTEKQQRYPDFMQASPHGLVPAIEQPRTDGGLDRVHDSMVVCEYIEDAFPDTSPLLPRAPGARARIRNAATDMSTRVLPLFYKMLMVKDPGEREQHKDGLVNGFIEFAESMDAPGLNAAFFLGDTFSLADIAVAPWFERMLSVGAKYRALTISKEDKHKRLWQWYESCLARPSFSNTIVSQNRLILNYSGYADGSATSDVAKTLVGVKDNNQMVSRSKS